MTTSVHELDLPEIDMTIDLDREEALALFDGVRARHWLARTPMGYLVCRHEDVTAILRDRRWHSAAAMITEMAGLPEDGGFLDRQRESILTMEGEPHARLRRIVAGAFTPKQADKLRPFMREVIGGLVDEFAPDGRCELVADVCEPYPIPIVCELLGAPKEDWKLFSHWATEIFKIFNNDLLNDMPAIDKANAELDAYIRAMVAERRSKPADDLLTDLIAAEEAGDKLSTDEMVGLAGAVLMAGTDTTRNQLACSVALLAQHPEQWKLLADQPELAPRAVEETMRYLGAVRGTARFASEDIEFRGVVFPKGTLIATSLSGANHDPETWQEPTVFDITATREAPQMTFGSGVHFCLGANLARAELQEALHLLARRMPNLAIDGVIEWKPSSVGIWGPARLPLRFDPEH